MKPFFIKLILLLVTVAVITVALAWFLPRPALTENAEINDEGELILYYSDGTHKNLGRVEGEKGERGEKGLPGASDSDGQDGSISVGADDASIPLAAAKGLQSSVSIACMQGQDVLSWGSGVIYQYDKARGDAIIVTNFHVVYNDNTGRVNNDIVAYLYGAEYIQLQMSTTYLGGSPTNDIAVLRVTGSNVLKKADCAAVTISDSDKVSVGSTAIAVGNAKGMGTSVSSGIISVDSEYITMASLVGTGENQLRVMRMDTAVNPGNSGGGLYNASGELIGIVNAKITADKVENIAYAIPSNLAISVANNIIRNCNGSTKVYAQKANLGIEEKIDIYNSKAIYDSDTGLVSILEAVRVSQEPASDSLAYGKLQSGDILLGITVGDYTVNITRMYQIPEIALRVKAGDVVTFNVLRNGQEQTVSITVPQNNFTPC